MACRAAVQASPVAKLSDLKVACFSAHKYVLDAQVRTPPQDWLKIYHGTTARVMRCPAVLIAAVKLHARRHGQAPPFHSQNAV